MTTIQSPTGLNISPNTPSPKRISKNTAIALAAVFVFVFAAISYGAWKRAQSQKITAAASEDTNRISALSTAKSLKKELRDTANTDAEKTKQPTPPPLEPIQPQPSTPDLTKTPGNPLLSNTQPPPTTGANVNHDPTAEDKRRLAAYQRQTEALNAPTSVALNNRPGAAASTGASSALPDLLSTLQRQQPTQESLQNALNRALGRTQNTEDQSTSDQSQKEAFLEKARARREDAYLKSTRLPQLTAYEIKAGWDIPAVLEQSMNSDLPGEIRAMVRANVYDSATGQYLLIPQGARVVGYYNSSVAYGQNGLQVVWTRLIFPDGSSVTLDGMVGQDQAGASGFRSQVDHHYTRLFGTALLTSGFAAALGVAQNTGQQNTLVTPSNSQIAGQAVAQNVTQLGIDITRKNLNVAPTIKIPAGYKFNIRVNRDILLDQPYSDSNQSEKKATTHS
jgi:type IV secretory pathway VirB10-like protein